MVQILPTNKARIAKSMMIAPTILPFGPPFAYPIVNKIRPMKIENPQIAANYG